jgi:molybdopterin synthase sulfur carrier subunit
MAENRIRAGYESTIWCVVTAHVSRVRFLSDILGRTKAVTIRVYMTPMLVKHLQARSEIQVAANNLGSLLLEVDRKFDGFRDSVCDESGRIRRYVNVFVNGLNVGPNPEALSTPLEDGDEVYFLASVAGG